ncbi:hypothetical protein CEXT_665081 [Caerostris extrusa]|uniref:Uncharacterized protein n=1 Tax=Caerostris extrusa TaxID=172846 RepID=A0AAV4RKH9_CAEEX|nr:hypothetical protein CEXT_665081 [Caerostris extrusa]
MVCNLISINSSALYVRPYPHYDQTMYEENAPRTFHLRKLNSNDKNRRDFNSLSVSIQSRIQQRKSSINRSVQSVFEHSIHGLLLLHNASVSQQHYRRRNVVKGSKSLTELFNITHRALSPPVCHLPLLLSRPAVERLVFLVALSVCTGAAPLCNVIRGRHAAFLRGLKDGSSLSSPGLQRNDILTRQG